MRKLLLSVLYKGQIPLRYLVRSWLEAGRRQVRNWLEASRRPAAS